MTRAKSNLFGKEEPYSYYVVEMKLLKQTCIVCGERADYEISEVRKYDNPKVHSGRFSIAYCAKCLRQEDKDGWNANVWDLPNQQIK